MVSSPARESRKQEITQRRRKQILDAALHVYTSKGTSQATTAEIAQAAGVAEGTIFNYFPTKRELLLALISDHILNEPSLALLSHPSGLDYEYIAELIRSRLRIGFDSVDVLFLMLSEMLHDPELGRQYAERVASPLLALVEGYLKSREAEGEFRPLNVSVVARALTAMAIGLSVLRRIEGEGSPLDETPLSDISKELTELILDGLRRR